MANEQRAYITLQGDLNSRKLYDPSGVVVMSPRGFKTFRNSAPSRHDGLKSAVSWAMKKGFTVHLVKPEPKTHKTAAFNALLTERFNIAVEAAQAAAAFTAFTKSEA